MAIIGDTGNGATVTLSSTSFSGRVMSIKCGEMSTPMLDVSALQDTGNIKKLAGDLVDGGDVEIEYVWNDNFVAVTGNATDPETLTITFPGGGTLSGTGKVTKSGGVELKNNTLMVSKFTFTFNGDTGPTYA